MKYSLTLGRVAGIRIAVHWTFVLLPMWIVYTSMRAGKSTEEIVWMVLFVFSIFFCVVLHELGHALAAKRYKITTRDITLLPIGGVARLERMPDNPSEELVIALAGPAVNLLIAAVLFPFLMLSTQPDMASLDSINASNFLLSFVVVNITLLVFNMIPAFPMDGGRVLRALLSMRLQRHVATRIAATIGQLMAILFTTVGFFYNPFLIFIGLFIFISAQAEAETAKTRFMLEGYTVRDVLMTDFRTIDASASVKQAAAMLLEGQCRHFLVIEDGRHTGTLSREDIIRALSTTGETTPVSRAAQQMTVTLSPEMSLTEALQMMQEHHNDFIPVYHAGQLAGVLDNENIMELVMIRGAMRRQES